jgi:drug/metabolite transporter (DMT)-like permease
VPALLALLSSVVWGTADFVGGLVSRRRPAFAVVAWAHVCALVGVLVWCAVVGAFDDPRGYLPWGMAAGLLGLGSLACFYEALAVGTMGVVAPIAASGVIVPVVIGLGQGESPSGLQLAGIAFAVVGIILASGPELRAVEGGTATGGKRSLVLAGLSAVGFGLVLWLIGKAAVYSVPMTLLTQRATSVTLAVVVALVLGSVGGVRPHDLLPIACVGVADAAANGLYAYASTDGLLSVISVLGSLYPVATVLLARFVLHERLARVQQVGVAVALAGVVMLGAG